MFMNNMMTSLQKRKKKSFDGNFIDRLNVSKTLFLKAIQYRPVHILNRNLNYKHQSHTILNDNSNKYESKIK